MAPKEVRIRQCSEMCWSDFDVFRRRAAEFMAFTLILAFSPMANATDIEPRAYSNIPVGVNFLVSGYSYTTGSVSFAPSVPINNAKLDIHSLIFAYARSLDVWGRSGKVDILIPTASLSGTAEVSGQSRSRNVAGFADPVFRFHVNWFGAPALPLKDFAAYRQKVIIGTSLAISAPGGQYDPDKLVNLGTNRWSFKPEIGLSSAWEPFTAEVSAGAYFFTDNQQPFQGRNLQQDPLYTIQSHFVYSFGPGFWGALDLNYYTGGRTATDGKFADNRLENLRIGGTLSLPLNRHHSLKLFGNTGIYTRTGAHFDIVGIAWQYRWGEGI